MPIFEAEEAEEGDFIAEEPPPAGSAAYRRVILGICATWTSQQYDQAMRPVFQWRGWRAAVEVMCELMVAVSINVPPGMIDAFGNVKLDSLVDVMDDEEILRYAHSIAPKTHPELPRHEALSLAITEGEDMRDMILDLVPVWNQAATVLRNASTYGDMDKARVLFTRWLNTYENRVAASTLGASITHGYWRHRCMPPGDEWIDAAMEGGPDVTGSLAWAREAGLDDIRRKQPDLVDNWVTRTMAETPKRAKKKRKKCCPNCGRQPA